MRGDTMTEEIKKTGSVNIESPKEADEFLRSTKEETVLRVFIDLDVLFHNDSGLLSDE